VLVALMLVGCLLLWIGVPVGWLWVGSQVQGSSGLATAMLVTMTGAIATIVVMTMALGWLNGRHSALRAARNLPSEGYSVLEAILVVSAGLALVIFGIWFFGFAGAQPIPLF
jgi:hypothetical protein